MATTHTTHSHRYWYVRLLRDDQWVDPNYRWFVAAPDHIEAIHSLVRNGMLPTNCTEESNGGSGSVLLPGYSLDPEVVEWEGDGTVARLF